MVYYVIRTGIKRWSVFCKVDGKPHQEVRAFACRAMAREYARASGVTQ
jgi:hypothetical protein